MSDWRYGDWDKDKNDTCQGDPVYRTREGSRKCYPRCNDKKECICPSLNVDCTTTSEYENTTGTKVIDCDKACDWSTWKLAADSKKATEVCSGKSFDQTWEKSRTCPRDDCSQCNEETKTEKRSKTGTKKITCDTACDSWQWEKVGKVYDAANICKGKTVTQSLKGTRTCPRDTCSQCETETTKTEPVTGTKTTPCNTHCSWLQCQEGDWTPATNDVKKGEPFTQECKQRRTCSGLCSGTTCTMQRTIKRPATGTKEPPVTPTSTVKEEKSAATAQASTCHTECSAGCDDWTGWNWSPSCPANTAFDKPSETQSRSRSRTCTDLCKDVECFTSNSETRPCAYCQGTGQMFDTKGNCVCAHEGGYYKDGTACKLCEAPKLLKQSGSTYECVDQACSDCEATACSAWTKGDYATGSELPENVCAGTNFTATYTETRTCTDCPCDTTRKTPYTEEGRKTNTCEECNWSTWSTWSTEACPAPTSMEKPTQQQSRTRTRVCDNVDCPPQNCAAETDNKDCPYCQGTGQKLDSGTGTCVCKSAERYYLTGNTCTKCPSTNVFDASAGTCTACTATGQTVVNNVCVCPEGQELNTAGNACVITCPEGQKLNSAGNACVITCPEGQTRNSAGDGCVCKNTDETIVNGVCKGSDLDCDDCNPWTPWNSWQTTASSCTSSPNDSFTPHSEVKRSRQRSRDCPGVDLKKYGCFTSNIEQQFCPWCKGKGQIRNATGECICQADYYKDDELGCRQCDAGKTPNEAQSGCICANTADKEACGNHKWDTSSCECRDECSAAAIEGCNSMSGEGNYVLDETCTCTTATYSQPEPVPHAKFYLEGCKELLVPGTDTINNERTAKWMQACNQEAYNLIRQDIRYNCSHYADAFRSLYACAEIKTDDKPKIKNSKNAFRDLIRGVGVSSDESCHSDHARQDGQRCTFPLVEDGG